MKDIFTAPDTWSGGYFETVTYIGGVPDSSVLKFSAAIWEYPLLEGPYSRDDREPTEQSIEKFGSLDPTGMPKRSGVATFTGGKTIACAHFMY